VTDALAGLATQGVLGCVVVVLAVAYLRLQKQYEAAVAARVTDAQKVAAVHLDMQKEWMTQINNLTGAVERLGDRDRRR